MSRAAMYHLLSTDGVLNALGIQPATVYQTNTVDNPEVKPFIVVRWETKTVSFEKHGPQNVAVWAHDDRGDYSRIDNILERVQDILIGAEHILGTDGRILTCARYNGTSDDLWDDGYQTITRYCTFSVISRAS